ncbi:hypothetical protein BDN70DRAFT_483489 [Pholiota conissans]|uniref:Uncharacterized protein n=1 Tax=Pholiota conissans TaxID=109636 RepID=A0A9P5YPH4_9AGAR|nr:hypothetical protein BDN70DRAFT_483489 [Pholiota conissans]
MIRCSGRSFRREGSRRRGSNPQYSVLRAYIRRAGISSPEPELASSLSTLAAPFFRIILSATPLSTMFWTRPSISDASRKASTTLVMSDWENLANSLTSTKVSEFNFLTSTNILSSMVSSRWAMFEEDLSCVGAILGFLERRGSLFLFCLDAFRFRGSMKSPFDSSSPDSQHLFCLPFEPVLNTIGSLLRVASSSIARCLIDRVMGPA